MSEYTERWVMKKIHQWRELFVKQNKNIFWWIKFQLQKNSISCSLKKNETRQVIVSFFVFISYFNETCFRISCFVMYNFNCKFSTLMCAHIRKRHEVIFWKDLRILSFIIVIVWKKAVQILVMFSHLNSFKIGLRSHEITC